MRSARQRGQVGARRVEPVGGGDAAPGRTLSDHWWWHVAQKTTPQSVSGGQCKSRMGRRTNSRHTTHCRWRRQSSPPPVPSPSSMDADGRIFFSVFRLCGGPRSSHGEQLSKPKGRTDAGTSRRRGRGQAAVRREGQAAVRTSKTTRENHNPNVNFTQTEKIAQLKMEANGQCARTTAWPRRS